MIDTARLIREVWFRYSRSGGPGGQNVNKLETKVELLFDVMNSSVLSGEEKTRVVAAEKNRIGSDGVLRIVSNESRSQYSNRETAVERFVEIVGRALRRKKKRRKTAVSAASREKRLEGKKNRSRIKKLRSRPEY